MNASTPYTTFVVPSLLLLTVIELRQGTRHHATTSAVVVVVVVVAAGQERRWRREGVVVVAGQEGRWRREDVVVGEIGLGGPRRCGRISVDATTKLLNLRLQTTTAFEGSVEIDALFETSSPPSAFSATPSCRF